MTKYVGKILLRNSKLLLRKLLKSLTGSFCCCCLYISSAVCGSCYTLQSCCSHVFA